MIFWGAWARFIGYWTGLNIIGRFLFFSFWSWALLSRWFWFKFWIFTAILLMILHWLRLPIFFLRFISLTSGIMFSWCRIKGFWKWPYLSYIYGRIFLYEGGLCFIKTGADGLFFKLGLCFMRSYIILTSFLYFGLKNDALLSYVFWLFCIWCYESLLFLLVIYTCFYLS